MRKVFVFICLLLLLSFFAIRPLLIPGFFPMHDDTQPSRVFEMANSLQDGLFPVRWVEHLGYGYGYPIFNFYAPFAYYVGSLFVLIGFDALVATKIMIGLGIVSAGVTMYLLARQFWGNAGGFLSGLLYLFAPYHALNVYVRGDIAEVYAYAFVPLVFLGMFKVFSILSASVGLRISEKSSQTNKKSHHAIREEKHIWRWITLGAISYAGLITSHNLTALMVTAFIVLVFALFSFISYRQKKLFSIRYLLVIVFVGLLLSAFYWLPVPFEMGYTDILSQVGGKADYRLHFVCPEQLWNSPWGFGGSAGGCVDGMSYRLGKLHIALAIAALLVMPLVWRKSRNHAFTLLTVLILLGISIWLMTDSSKFLWDAIPVMAFFQYPWRFLLLATFFASFVGGSIIWMFRSLPLSRTVMQASMIGTMLVIIGAGSLLYPELFVPQTILPKNVGDYTGDTSLRWNISKISDEYLPPRFEKPQNEFAIVTNKLVSIDNNAIITITEEKTQKIAADILMKADGDVLVKTAYFPAWKVRVDNKEHPFLPVHNGMKISLPRGKHSLSVQFSQTPIEKLANIISLSGIVVLLAGIMKERRKV